MYPVEQVFTLEEEEIIFRIRQLIGDDKEVFVDEKNVSFSNILASGTMYEFSEIKAYPQEIYVNGIEYTSITNPSIIGYKFLKFSAPVLVSGANLTVIYDHFRHSDVEIIQTYDTSAFTYLTKQCNLTVEELGVDLLVLSTAYILLMKDLNTYIKSAIRIKDSDSEFDGSGTSGRPTLVMNLLKSIADELLVSLKAKTSCKMLHLPVYKVE